MSLLPPVRHGPPYRRRGPAAGGYRILFVVSFRTDVVWPPPGGRRGREPLFAPPSGRRLNSRGSAADEPKKQRGRGRGPARKGTVGGRSRLRRPQHVGRPRRGAVGRVAEVHRRAVE